MYNKKVYEGDVLNSQQVSANAKKISLTNISELNIKLVPDGAGGKKDWEVSSQ